jgi:hypothetical protein
MKRIVLYTSLFIALFASCTDDLNLVPVGSLTGNNFYKTDNDAVVAVNGVYVPNAQISSALDYLVDGASDALQSGETVQGDGGATLPQFKYSAGNTTIAAVWQRLFEGVASAGAVIEGVEASGNSEIKTRVINEAKFLRALYYFYAVQLWGEVPLVLKPSDGENATREPVDNIYAQIVADLESAKNLPASTSYSSDDKGRASRGAAWGLLSKVYLVWKQTSAGAPPDSYAKSVEAADKVIGFGDYALQDEFTDNWQWEVGKRDGKEILFSAHHAVSQFAPGEGGNHMTHCSFAEGFSNPYATNHLAVTNRSFYDKFDPADQRREGSYVWTLSNPQASAGEDGYTPVTFRLPIFRKAININDPLKGNKDHDLDRIILRLADIYLIKAEALNEQGKTPEAFAALNVVRRRAFRQPVNQPSPLITPVVREKDTGLAKEADKQTRTKGGNPVDLSGNADDFRQYIQEERYFEFVFEQQRWFDLVRWKTLITTVKQHIPVESGWQWDDPNRPELGGSTVITFDKDNVALQHYRFPIPQTERSKNPAGLWQNWGYEGATGDNPYDSSYK